MHELEFESRFSIDSP